MEIDPNKLPHELRTMDEQNKNAVVCYFARKGENEIRRRQRMAESQIARAQAMVASGDGDGPVLLAIDNLLFTLDLLTEAMLRISE